MKYNTYPFNYLKSIKDPITAFKNRHALKWSQIFVVFTFITFLLTTPVFRHYQQIDVYSLNDFFPEIVDAIDDEVVDNLSQTEFSKGKLLITEPFKIESNQAVIGAGLDLSEFEGVENLLLFEEDHYIVRDDSEIARSVRYSSMTSFTGKSRDEIIHELSETYTNEYRGDITFSLITVVYSFIIAFTAFIVFVYAFLLKSMQDFSMSSILTYKEAVNLILNLMAIPTLLAVLIGFIQFNLILMFTIQVISLILMLLYLYKQTNFEDA